MSKKVVLIFFVAIVLCFAGFNNKFPLLGLESGKYIEAAFNRGESESGLNFYGVFVAHASWMLSLWLVVLMQGILVAITMYLVFKHLCNRSPISFYVLYIFFIVFLMSASFSVSTIGPGVFGAINLLCLVLLLFAATLSLNEIIFVSILFLVSSLMGTSIVASASVLWLLYCFRDLAGRFRVPAIRPLTEKKGLCIAAIVLIASWSIWIATALYSGKGMAGIWGGLADAPASGISSRGVGSKVIDRLNISISGYKALSKDSKTFRELCNYLPWDVREYMISRQNQHWLTFKVLNYSQMLVCVLCLAVAAFLLARRRGLVYPFVIHIGIFIVTYIGGSLLFRGVPVCGAPCVVWLLPLPFFLSPPRLINQPNSNDKSKLS